MYPIGIDNLRFTERSNLFQMVKGNIDCNVMNWYEINCTREVPPTCVFIKMYLIVKNIWGIKKNSKEVWRSNNAIIIDVRSDKTQKENKRVSKTNPATNRG